MSPSGIRTTNPLWDCGVRRSWFSAMPAHPGFLRPLIRRGQGPGGLTQGEPRRMRGRRSLTDRLFSTELADNGLTCALSHFISPCIFTNQVPKITLLAKDKDVRSTTCGSSRFARAATVVRSRREHSLVSGGEEVAESNRHLPDGAGPLCR